MTKITSDWLVWKSVRQFFIGTNSKKRLFCPKNQVSLTLFQNLFRTSSYSNVTKWPEELPFLQEIWYLFTYCSCLYNLLCRCSCHGILGLRSYPGRRRNCCNYKINEVLCHVGTLRHWVHPLALVSTSADHRLATLKVFFGNCSRKLVDLSSFAISVIKPVARKATF